jgi:hypothetical protein
MKKILVIIDLPSARDAHNLLNAAIQSQILPEGVSQPTACSWLINANKSFSFCASLVNTAQKQGYHVAVLPTDDDIILLSPFPKGQPD